jgi:hypothetical protein
MSDAEKAARKTPGKMTTWIGRWNNVESVEGEPGKTFTVLAEIEGATEKQVKEAVKGLGFGKYETITGRCGEPLNYREVIKPTFV